MAVISIKCSDKEKQAFQTYCDKKGVTVSEELRELMNKASDHTPSKISINTLDQRVKALEDKFDTLLISDIAPYKVDPSTLGELITLNEIAVLTGYSTSTLGSKLSREGIKAVERIAGNKGGLYSKAEVLDKVGYKN